MREKCEKVGSHSGRDDWINFEMPEDHFPDKVSYELNDVFRDLLIFAQSHLRPCFEEKIFNFIEEMSKPYKKVKRKTRVLVSSRT